MSEFTVGQRVKFNYDVLPKAVERIVSPTQYGTVTVVKDGSLFVQPDGETFSVTMRVEHVTQVKP